MWGKNERQPQRDVGRLIGFVLAALLSVASRPSDSIPTSDMKQGGREEGHGTKKSRYASSSCALMSRIMSSLRLRRTKREKVPESAMGSMARRISSTFLRDKGV